MPQDQTILSLAGADTTGKIAGPSAYLKAEKAGETTLTVTHPKTNYSLVYHVIVPGADAVEVSLDKNYIEIEKGKNTTVKATVSSKKSSDYNSLVWSISRVNGEEIATVNGTGADGVGGQTVTIYGLKAGTVYLSCEYPGSGSIAQCQVTIKDPKSFTLDRQVIRLQPNSTKTFNYTVTPPDADINWVYASNTDGTDVFQPFDNGHDSEGRGTVTITSFKEGTGVLSGVSSYGSKVNIQVQVAWDYEFTLKGNTYINIMPDEAATVQYTVHPADAEITISSTERDKFQADLFNNGDGTGSIVIKPLTETSGEIQIVVNAKNKSNGEQFGEETIRAKFRYSKFTPVISFMNSDGNFSKYDSDTDTLTIGDGEMAELRFDIKEQKTSAYVSKVNFTPIAGVSSNVSFTEENAAFTTSYKTCKIGESDEHDEKEYQYRIEKAYVPKYKGNEISNWETRFHWLFMNCKHSGSWNDWYFALQFEGGSDYRSQACIKQDNYYWKNYYRYLVNRSGDGNNNSYDSYDTSPYDMNWNKDGTSDDIDLVEDKSLAGKIYPKDDFEEIGWFYCPGTRIKDWEGDIGNPGDELWDCEMKNCLNRVCDWDESYLVVKDHVIKAHVTAIYEAVPDTTPSIPKLIGYITLTLNRFGKDEKCLVNEKNEYMLPVYYEVRKCAKTYNGD